MKRRALIGFMASGVAAGIVGWRPALAAGGLTPSGPVNVTRDGTVIENLDIVADHTAITMTGRRNVTIRNCRIHHNMAGDSRSAFGIFATKGSGLVIEGCEVINGGAPSRGALPSDNKTNILISHTENVRIRSVTVRSGSSGVYLQEVAGSRVEQLESHDIRGPYPRGTALQYAGCSGSHVGMDLSDESIPGTSFNEDNFSVFGSPNVALSRIKVPLMSDAVSGRGLVVEEHRSTDCRIEDAEFGWLFNGMVALEGSRLQVVGTRMRGWNRYSVRGLPGSSLGGKHPPAMLAVGKPVSALKLVNEYWDAAPSNLVFNPDRNAGIKLRAVDWKPRLSVVRNRFPWRNERLAPEMLLPVRIGSYWQPNPNTGEPGVYGNAIRPGAILGVLPGKYANDPTALRWQWYRDGVAIAGQVGMNYTVRSKDIGATIAVAETPSNAAGVGLTQLSAGIVC